MNNTLLDVQNLSVEFSSKDDSFLAVNKISFVIEKGKTLSLVGESGSGKSVTALSILQLLPAGSASHNQQSSIKFEGKEIIGSSKSFITSLRGNKISMIFQEPMTSLNPVLTVEDCPREGVRFIALYVACERMHLWERLKSSRGRRRSQGGPRARPGRSPRAPSSPPAPGHSRPRAYS